MSWNLGAAGLLAAAVFATEPARADDADLSAIRSEMNALKHDYEARLKALDARLKRAEADAKAARTDAALARGATPVATPPASPSAPVYRNAAGKIPAVPPPMTAPTTVAQAPAPPTSAPAPVTIPPVIVPPLAQVPVATAPRAPASANAFNPGISVTLNGFLAGSTKDPTLARIPGFVVPDDAGLLNRGFSIGESEVTLAANIDPYLKGFLNLSFSKDNQASVEEAYVQTAGLGGGLNVKGGRFFSGIAYLNERHSHEWSFSDASLPYRAFLGNQYGDDGVQVRWLVPTSFYLEAGAEWFAGNGFPAGGAANGGKGTYTGFLHAGGDFNDSFSWLAGLSYLHAGSDNRVNGSDTFDGKDDLGIASLVLKWAPNGNPVRTNLVLSGEYFYDRESGVFDTVPIDLKRDGWYAQAVYKFRPHWSLGARYAELSPDDVPLALAGTTLNALGNHPRAETGLLEYDTSEFGRLRLQYTHDQSDLRKNDEVTLQYTIVYGPHGAHRY